MRDAITCPRCKGAGSVYAAGNRIARECPSCEGKGRITEGEATLSEPERELLSLEDRVREAREEWQRFRACPCIGCRVLGHCYLRKTRALLEGQR